MAVIIVDNGVPDAATATARLTAQAEGLRLLVSPDLIARFSAEELPSGTILNPVYLDPAENQVLTDTSMTEADVAATNYTGSTYDDLVVLTQWLLAIEQIPQLAQLVQNTILQQSERYQEIDWQARLTALNQKYVRKVKEINPSTDLVDTESIPVKGATTESEEIDFDVPYYSRTELYGRTP